MNSSRLTLKSYWANNFNYKLFINRHSTYVFIPQPSILFEHWHFCCRRERKKKNSNKYHEINSFCTNCFIRSLIFHYFHSNGYSISYWWLIPGAEQPAETWCAAFRHYKRTANYIIHKYIENGMIIRKKILWKSRFQLENKHHCRIWLRKKSLSNCYWSKWMNAMRSC